jgi:tRNA A-37 threonylcarbamoyl transferase component Bud32
MTADKPTTDPAAFAIVADRYELQRDLGRGGMATIHEVVDRASGARLALKRLLRADDGADQEHLEVLFEQEFHTLSQLAHPRVVRVHDFMRFDDVAFYTMELLDGGDLTDLAPLPWRRVCALLIDVCSALSLLHSRRLVHRDLTPRNVRCTHDGTAKLIDFGAMMRFGPARRLVGTPAYIAPEALDSQPLDGRADLFGLGATAYYALTGQHAFAVRTLAAARAAHAFRPQPPSSVVPDVPAALDQLVMSLIQLSPLARPADAAEVMERLSVISGVAIDDQLAIRSAYLSSPTLVGRDSSLTRVHKHIERARRGRGSSLLVTGPSGVGRSRFVEACTLEAKLMGAVVLRADADDGAAGDFGGAATLAARLLDSLPELALQHARAHAAVLAHVAPQLIEQLAETDTAVAGLTKTAFPSALERRAHVQSALSDWLQAIAAERCLMIAIDDFHLLDEATCALLATLAHAARGLRLLIVVSADSAVPFDGKDALGLLTLSAQTLRLEPLAVEDTERLLSSVFGDVPNVRLLAHRLYEPACGSPRALMQITQQLVDEGVIFYTGGAWTLPAELQRVELPHSQTEVLSQRLPKLQEAARELAHAFALSTRRSLSLQDSLALTGHDTARLLGLLEELMTAGIITGDGIHYRLNGPTWRRVLSQDLNARQTAEVHARLARLRWNDEGERFQAVQHLWQASETGPALRLMLEHAVTVEQNYTRDAEWFFEYVRSLPRDWLESCEALYRQSAADGCSRRERFTLLGHMVACAPPSARSLPERLRECVQQLYEASGLLDYDQLSAESDPAKRLQLALTQAQQRFDQTPEHERTVPVGEAIPRLARCIVHAIAMAGRACDYHLMAAMPSLAPLAPLSPLLAVVQKNAQCTLHALAGRFDRARDGYLEIKTRMEHGGGLDDPRHRSMYLAVIYAVGAIETGTGIEGGERWAELIEDHSLFAVNAWRLRLMAALRKGDFALAQELKQKLELIRIQNSPPQLFEGMLQWIEALCYAVSDDMARVKQVIPRLEVMAAESPTWTPMLQYAKGQYQRLRGDHARALAEFEIGLALVSPGQHICWAALAGACVSALSTSRQPERAVECGRAFLASIKAHDLQCAAQPILQGLALALGTLGDFEAAQQHAQTAVDIVQGFGTRGIGLASAFETQARLAILMNDPQAFRRHAAACAQLYKAGNDPSLTAKYERLLYDARGVVPDSVRERSTLHMGEGAASRMQTMVTRFLSACDDLPSRAQEALRLLVEHTDSTGGYLYTLERDGLSLRAQCGQQAALKNMDQLASGYLAAELDEEDEVTATGTAATGSSTLWAAAEGRFIPLVLAHTGEQGRLITGIALLHMPADQSFTSPGALVPALSRALGDAGEVHTAIAPS